MDKEKSLIKIKELVDQFSNACKNKDYINSQSEENIKNHYIEPLFEALGWTRWDMFKETRVLKGRADYIFKIGNEEVLVVEAKKVNVPLTEEEGRQAVSYAYHRKIKFAVLTNFKEIRVYHALSNILNIDRNLLKFESGGYFKFTFEQLIDNFDKLKLLSRESIEKKELNQLLSKKDEKASKPIDKSILDDLLEIREWLSKDLKKLRIHLTKEQIDEIVQILIDRLIFIRSVEDRGLEEKDFLLKMTKDFQEGRTEKRLWESLKIKFKIFDKEYNSKLFAEGLLEKEGFFDDQILIKVIRELYFGNEGQQERYMFDIIPGDLLGTIYEQYLGTILEGTEKRVKLDSTSGKRKKMGIYYTPSYIVDYIVKNTIGEYLKDKTIDEILEVRIVDPACGSGSFLIRAFQEVCNTVENRLKEGKRGNSNTFNKYRDRLTIDQKAMILSSCIYGVDLDEKAVELAQLNLLLKILEDEDRTLTNKRLPTLLSNIKNGNSLIDDSSIGGDKAFKWEAQFREVFQNGGFDIVIGNPPYFKIRESDPIKNTKTYLEIKSGMMNAAAIFIVRGLELTKKEGFMGMIVPKMLAFTESWEKVRRKILSSSSLNKVVDAGKAFDDVLLEQIIFCLKNKKVDNSHQMNIGKILNNNQIIDTTSVPQELCKKENKIYLEPDKRAYFIKEKMEKSDLTLGDISEIFLGLGIQGMDNFIENPKKDYKKALGGNDIQRLYIRGYWYYNPLDKELNKYKNQMQKFYRPKIVTQRIVAHIKDHIKITAAFDEEGLFTFNTVTNIIVEDKNYNSQFVLLLLNSNIVQYYVYKFIYQNAIRSMDFYEAYAKQIPVPKSDKKLQEKLVMFVEERSKIQRKILEDRISGNEKERLEQQIKNIDYEIDQEIYNLYGINKEEQKIIEESLK